MDVLQGVLQPVLVAIVGWLVIHRINQLEVKMERRFELVPTRREMDARFDAVDARFDAVDARFDAVDARFDAVDARFDAVEARFVGLERRVGRVEDQNDSMRSDLTQIALAVGARLRPQTG